MELKNIPGIYLVLHITSTKPPDILYVGSTLELRRRWKHEHLNPNYNGHGDFGRWVHGENKTSELEFRVLETIKFWPGTRDELKRELKRREFLFKQKFPARFGQMDGLCMQPKEVQLAHRRKIDKAYRERNLEKVRKRKRLQMRKVRSAKKKIRLHKQLTKELLTYHRMRQKLIESASTISFVSKFMALTAKPKRRRRKLKI